MKKRLFLQLTLHLLIINFAFISLASTNIQNPSASLVSQKSKEELSGIVAATENGVVQVFRYAKKFNFLEPYDNSKVEASTGTAFFISSDGYLLTNFHVVEGTRDIFISFPKLGYQQIPVKVVGVCPRLDTALLKLDENLMQSISQQIGKINPLTFGDSDKVKCTDKLFAVGFPLGQRSLVFSSGDMSSQSYVPNLDCSYIQVTVPINPGNSGGPALDRNGKVVGINSASFFLAQNVGYIIPINDVLTVLTELKSGKNVDRPKLGVVVNNSTEDLAKSLGNPLPAGVYINKVQGGSIADKMGIKPGDMIYLVDGYSLDYTGRMLVPWSSDSGKINLIQYFMRLPLDYSLNLVIYRNGKKLELKGNVNSYDLAEIREVYPMFEPDEVLDYEMFGGIAIMPLRKNHIANATLQSTLYGVAALSNKSLNKYSKPEYSHKKRLVITKVLPGAYLSRKENIKAGMLLKEVNGMKVKTLQQLRDALRKSLTTGEVEIKTYEKAHTVISLDKLLKEEKAFAKGLNLPITKTMVELDQQFYSNK